MNNKSVIEKLEDIKYFKQIVKGHTTEEIIDLFYKTTGILLSKQQVKSQKKRLKLTSGINTKFKKGQKAVGKTFKKGNIPHNKKEGYYEFTSTNGYIYVKIDDNKFIQKQRYVWEQYYGKIPEGYYVMFLDQDKTNYDIDNLILVEKGAYMGAIGTELITNNAELNKALIYTEQLKEKIKEKVKQG